MLIRINQKFIRVAFVVLLAIVALVTIVVLFRCLGRSLAISSIFGSPSPDAPLRGKKVTYEFSDVFVSWLLV